MSAKRTSAKSSPRPRRAEAKAAAKAVAKTVAKTIANPALETPSRGRADLARLRRVSEGAIHRTSPAELRQLPTDFWDEAEVVLPEPKVPISLRVDADVLAFFRAAGPRYQSRMNAVLRAFMERSSDTPGKRGPRRRSA